MAVIFQIDIVDAFLILQYLLALGVIFYERRNPNSALGWVLVLVAIPVAGLFLYLFFGQDFTRKKLFSLKEADDMDLQDTIRAQKKELENLDLKGLDPRIGTFLPMVRMFLDDNRAFLTNDNSVNVFTDGTATFEALFEDIRNARHHIHLEYYIIRDDPLGRELVQLLTTKAGEGVEVRLLYDAMGMKIKKKGLAKFEAAGGMHAAFFPRIFTLNYRNHRKIVVIDGKVGFIGGYNVGDEYLGKGPLGYWRDAALRMEGTGVLGLQTRFFMDWNYAAGEDLSYTRDYFPEVEYPGHCHMQVVSSGPDNRYNPVKEGYLKLVASAKETLYIQTPYFIPDESVSDALRIAALSGVDVRIMIPCKPDHPFVYWATYSFIGDLLDAGIKAYTYDNGFIHAKTIVVDGIAASVGSANWDVRSFKLNFEANSFLYDEDIAGTLKRAFEEDLPKCTEITMDLYRKRSRRIKFKESISRLASPLG